MDNRKKIQKYNEVLSLVVHTGDESSDYLRKILHYPLSHVYRFTFRFLHLLFFANMWIKIKRNYVTEISNVLLRLKDDSFFVKRVKNDNG